MLKQNIILCFLWFCFGLIHSIFAGKKIKIYLESNFREGFRYYKSIYSVFAILSLSAVLYYHFTIHTIQLWYAGLCEKIISYTGILVALPVMLLFTRRFFFSLSGAGVFKSKPVQRELLQLNFYRHVRHPLYSATLLLIWSLFLLRPMLNNLITCFCITVYTIIGIYFEEKKLLEEFGESYKKYSADTPKLFPRLLIK